MELTDNATADDVLVTMKIYATEVKHRSKEFLDGHAQSPEDVEELASYVEKLLRMHGHICRLWKQPHRTPLAATEEPLNQPSHHAILTLKRLNNLVDHLSSSEDTKYEHVEEIYFMSLHAIEFVDNFL